MIKRVSVFLLLVLLITFTSSAFSQINIEKETLLKLPPELGYGLIGMRVCSGNIFIANTLGKVVRFNMDTGESFKDRIRGHRILDFDLILGQPVYLTLEGTLAGHRQKNWPEGPYDACYLEVSDQGLIMRGSDKMFFLADNATAAIKIDGFNFALPVKNAFLWSMGIKKAGGPWYISLFDCYGNLMKEVYKFSPAFDPTGIELGPIGEEGEVLISAYENNSRKLVLIGQNGHMIWKLDAPDKFCRRDVAFDGKGNLLVLEKQGGEIVLNRWKFSMPKG
ncbi:MAG: hypothetical protein Kow0029_06800 [Candidatus Rifleibacteriota bacterium]